MTEPTWTRRRLAGNALGLAAASAFPWYWYTHLRPQPPRINVHRPGITMGHQVRDHRSFPAPEHTWSCDVMIVGSGAAALTAAWKLKREGYSRFVMLEGPEPNGNNAGITNRELNYPSGAHYLALPSQESRHIREMLADIGVLQSDPYALAPVYDEMVLVHAPEERLLHNGTWQEAMLPQEDADSARFFALVEQLSQTRGNDGRPLFAIPLALSSQDTEWRALDGMTFQQWLQDNHYQSPSLLWYLNYCCRDDYGQGIQKVSAWAGLHYFACRTGHAQHAGKGAVLTWPDGLATLSNKLRDFVGFQKQTAFEPQLNVGPVNMAGTLLQAQEHPDHMELLIGVMNQQQLQTVRVQAQKVICAMPLYIASHVVQNIKQYGFEPAIHMPVYAPWMISNFVFTSFPNESEGAPLSWDNVVHNGPGLGYVVSTHQLIRAAKPERTAFTAYYAMDETEPSAVRNWMIEANEQKLVDKAISDLKLAYPDDLSRHLQQIDITLRGHAMASPTPGYLNNEGLKALQQNNSRMLFAHSDLSGYSVFEEAAWWGYQAALRIL